MATFTLDSHPGMSINLPADLSKAQLLSFHPFNSWLSTITHSLSLQSKDANHPFHKDPYTLRSISIQAFDLFGGNRLGFIKMKAEVSNAAGEHLPGAVFLRGPSVAMLVILIPDDAAKDSSSSTNYGDRHVLLTVQPRVAAGSLAFVELPAGMVDEAGAFSGTAAKEIKEELGLEIPASELTCLSELAEEKEKSSTEEANEGSGSDENLPLAMYPSAGGCDEYVPIYMHERRVPREQLGDWTGRLKGLRDDGEKITLKLVPMHDLWREGARDAKCLAALALWQGLKREGKI